MSSLLSITQTSQWRRLTQLTDDLRTMSARRQRQQFQALVRQRSDVAFALLPQTADLPMVLTLLALIRVDRQADAQRYVAQLLQQQPVACSTTLPKLTPSQLLLLAMLTATMTSHCPDVARLLHRVHRLSEQAHNALTALTPSP